MKRIKQIDPRPVLGRTRADNNDQVAFIMASFCKNEDCPPSQTLLAFLNGEISMRESSEIRTHLAVCEFCDAELAFYKHYPQLDEPQEQESPEMPEPLFELASALLANRHAGPGDLDSLLGFRSGEPRKAK